MTLSERQVAMKARMAKPRLNIENEATQIARLITEGLSLHELEMLFSALVIARAYRQAAGNQCQTARVLGVHRNTLARRLRFIQSEYGPQILAA